MKKKYWRAEYGNSYWFLDDDFIPQCVGDHNDLFDKEHYNRGNYFRTKKEAEMVARFADGYLSR